MTEQEHRGASSAEYPYRCWYIDNAELADEGGVFLDAHEASDEGAAILRAVEVTGASHSVAEPAYDRARLVRTPVTSSEIGDVLRIEWPDAVGARVVENRTPRRIGTPEPAAQ